MPFKQLCCTKECLCGNTRLCLQSWSCLSYGRSCSICSGPNNTCEDFFLEVKDEFSRLWPAPSLLLSSPRLKIPPVTLHTFLVPSEKCHPWSGTPKLALFFLLGMSFCSGFNNYWEAGKNLAKEKGFACGAAAFMNEMSTCKTLSWACNLLIA